MRRPQDRLAQRAVAAVIPRLPPDLWFAIAAAIAILLLGLVDPAYLFAAIYIAVCIYVGIRAFRG